MIGISTFFHLCYNIAQSDLYSNSQLQISYNSKHIINKEVLQAMNVIQKLFLPVIFALSLGSISTTAIAFEEGRKTMSPAGAIKAILGKIKEAEDAIDSGAEGEAVIPLLKQAILLGKEVNASDTVSRSVSKGRNHIKKARKEMKKENGQVAKQHLDKAAARFKKTLGML